MIKNRYHFLKRELQKQYPNIHDQDALFKIAKYSFEQQLEAKK